MYRNEREKELLAIIESNKYVTVEYLSAKLHISASSVRRDLAVLENRGLVLRSYGGVEIADSGNTAIPFLSRLQENKREKKRIAAAAAKLVREGDVIFADASSTVQYLLHEITGTHNLCVITNSVEALHFLAPYQVKVICTGGTLSYENRYALTGSDVLDAAENIRVDTAFFSARGIDGDGTMYDCYQDEIAVTRRIMANAGKRVLLADGSKAGKTSTFVKGNLSETDYVISNAPLNEKYAEKYPNTVFITA